MLYDKLESQKQYKRMSVTNHREKKQMCDKKFCVIDDVACANINLGILKNLLAKRCYKLFRSVVASESRMLRDFRIISEQIVAV